MDEEELIEKIAEIEREQWMEWSKSTIQELMGGPHDTKKIVAERVEEKHHEWLQYWKDYSELSEEVKDKDREWARKVLEVVKEEIDID